VPFDGAFSPIHWLIVAVVALLVLGPDRLPGAARRAARAWRDLQQTRSALVGHLRDMADDAVPVELLEPQPDRPDDRPTPKA
jgi:TatA/E family protein of Tat protein translocase